jgi:hypothetical protein
MRWVGQVRNNTDLALGLVLSMVLGSVIGLAMSHPLGHLILGSALGVIFLLTYMASFSLGAIWMMGTQQGLIVVSVFVWCVILSSWLSPTPRSHQQRTYFDHSTWASHSLYLLARPYGTGG